MRKPFSRQRRLDCKSPEKVSLNFECRHEIIPVFRGLQHIYSEPSLRDEILKRVGQDVNGASRDDCGRPGMDYWQILVLSAVRLGCDFDYDALQDLAEQHRALRQMMGLGDWDEDSFHFRRIHDNICLVRPETIAAIDHLIVGEGHRLAPEAPKKIRADSFVMETNIHYPSESTLIRDGVRKVIELAVVQAEARNLPGWRQHEHLLGKVRKLTRRIERIAARKGPDYQTRLKKPYRQLLQVSGKIFARHVSSVKSWMSWRVTIARCSKCKNSARSSDVHSMSVGRHADECSMVRGYPTRTNSSASLSLIHNYTNVAKPVNQNNSVACSWCMKMSPVLWSSIISYHATKVTVM